MYWFRQGSGSEMDALVAERAAGDPGTGGVRYHPGAHRFGGAPGRLQERLDTLRTGMGGQLHGSRRHMVAGHLAALPERAEPRAWGAQLRPDRDAAHLVHAILSRRLTR